MDKVNTPPRYEDWEALDGILSSALGKSVPPGYVPDEHPLADRLLDGVSLPPEPKTYLCQTYTPTPSWWQPAVGYHVQERYSEHYPHSTRNDILWDLAGGVQIDPELASVLLARRRISPEDFYIISRERRGIFILAKPRNPEESNFPTVMVTYLRLPSTGEAYALREWPIR
jgi:hypothetical protein